MHRVVKSLRIDLHEQLERIINHAVDGSSLVVSNMSKQAKPELTDSNGISSWCITQGRR